MGRRAVRRLFRWHVVTSTRTGPAFTTLAVAIAIVGALIFDPGISANTPYKSLRVTSDAAAGLRAGGKSDLPANSVVLSDGLERALTAAEKDDVVLGEPASLSALGYPPFGITPAGALTPADDVTPALFGSTVDRSADLQARVSAKKHHKAHQPARVITRTTAWKVAPIVTWYGPGFYGGKTACGQRYTRRIVGVASRTLRCGTLVQFSWHGISVVAPVIDRGPFATSAYVFDFSARLACDLFRERGQANGCFTRYRVQWRVVGRKRN